MILLEIISSSSVTRMRLYTNSFVISLSRTNTDLNSALPSLSIIQPDKPDTNVLAHSSISSPVTFRIFLPVALAEDINPQMPVLINPAITLHLLSFALIAQLASPACGNRQRLPSSLPVLRLFPILLPFLPEVGFHPYSLPRAYLHR